MTVARSDGCSCFLTGPYLAPFECPTDSHKLYRWGWTLMVHSGLREYEKKNWVLLPAAGRKTQRNSERSIKSTLVVSESRQTIIKLKKRAFSLQNNL